MSRKLDWADVEARKLADALGIDSDHKTSRGLIAATLRLAHSRGCREGMDAMDGPFARLNAALDVALGKITPAEARARFPNLSGGTDGSR